MTVRIAYLVHDLGDPAVARRVRMLLDGGASVSLAGFRRSAAPPADVEGVKPIDLGQTRDARLRARTGSVLRAALDLPRLRAALTGCQVVVARQLEMLLLGAWGRKLFAPSARLVYECVDVHRMLLGASISHSVLRQIEALLLRQCALLLVSSEAFVEHHFNRYPRLPPVQLLENRVLASELLDLAASRLPPGPPWRIGWFGNIRCARSLTMLAGLARTQPGRIEIVIRGRPAYAAIPHFDEVIRDAPGLIYGGPYDRRTELATLYGDVHFAWAIDRYEVGGNSEWLLPNRMYEAAVHGCAILAQRGTATAAWLAVRQAGVLLDEPVGTSLASYFGALTQADYRDAIGTLDPACLQYDFSDCCRLVASLAPPGTVTASFEPADAHAALRSAVSTLIAE